MVSFYPLYFLFPILVLLVTFLCQLFDISIIKVYNFVLMSLSISFYYVIWMLLQFFNTSDI